MNIVRTEIYQVYFMIEDVNKIGPQGPVLVRE